MRAVYWDEIVHGEAGQSIFTNLSILFLRFGYPQNCLLDHFRSRTVGAAFFSIENDLGLERYHGRDLFFAIFFLALAPSFLAFPVRLAALIQCGHVQLSP